MREGRPWHATAEMIDRFTDGFTAMARTTCFPASIAARMIADGTVKARGVQRPEAIIAGAAADRLLRELLARGIRVDLAEGPPGATSAGPPATPGSAR
jgi:saccharopine dehydrogenase-like NADP-dependent oxidoreductase